MNAVDLIKLNIEIEYVIDSAGLLVPLSGIDPAEAPCVYVIRHEGGYVTYFRHDLPHHTCKQLVALDLGIFLWSFQDPVGGTKSAFSSSNYRR